MSTATPPRKSASYASTLRDRIKVGDLEPGARLPSVTELRRELGIASATAERIYASLENEGFVVRRQGAGTFVAGPEGRGINAKSSRAGYIGLACTAISAQEKTSRDPIWSHLSEAVQTSVTRLQRRVILLTHDSELGWDDVEGVVVVHSGVVPSTEMMSSRTPCVALMYPSPALTTVMADEFEGGCMAVRHLMELGHRRIGMLYLGANGPGDEITSRRLAGYQLALRQQGIVPPEAWSRGFDIDVPADHDTRKNLHLKGGYEEMRNWLGSGWRETGCTAIVAQNDQIAIGAMRALHEVGINVPGDVSVIGFDGTETGESCTPPLTSVRIPVEDMAAVATAVLVRKIGGEAVMPQRITLPPSIVVRESTGPPKIEVPEL